MVVIENKEYDVCEDEFKKIYKLEYCNLEMYDDIGLYERISGLINDFSSYMSNYSNSINKIFINSTHGGFLPILCSMNDNEKQNEKSFTYFENKENQHYINYTKNVERHNIKNINEITKEHLLNLTANNNYNILFCDNFSNINDFINKSTISNTIIITSKNDFLENTFEYKYRLTGTPYTIYISNEINYYFYICFKYYIENYGSEDFKLDKHDIIFNYDNLINLCIMVKNGGDQFETMLRENIHLIDNWTILDTGSTDNTIEIINRVLVGKKKGNLYQEPFINFRDSRNRLLELAGTSCKYTLMLDDTYIIKGDLRKFLTETRGDQFSDSFTLYIKSDDVEYGSNRILKTNRKLKYWFKIHEVVQSENNNNVVIPINDAFIFDGRFDYMEKRTMERKELDLKLLYEELEDDHDNSRTHYYLGQTYNLLEQYEEAFKWFMERVNHKKEGFLQEKVDSAFEGARIANFKLNMSWDIVEELYNKAYELDNERPDALYFIGVNYYLKNNYHKAYEYFKKSFEIGYPSHRQYSLKPTLSFHFLPKFLTKTCYTIGDYQLGEKASDFFIKYNNPNEEDYEEIVSWYKIYKLLNTYNSINQNHTSVEIENEEKPIFVFVADGGFNKWSGKNIITTGVGGSETYIIEMARYIQQTGLFNVVVFCNCSENEFFEGVLYKRLNEYINFIKYTPVHTCIVSRFSEYLPISYEGLTKNVYLVVHDLTPSGNVIIKNPKLKNIFCLTEWHVEYFNSIFPQMLHDMTVPFYYGIDQDKFTNKKNIQKVPYKFIYSSFPNRGLLPLLQLWPQIYNKETRASLHIYSDVNGKWVNDVAAEQMIEVRKLLEMHKDMNIYYHGWVDKQTLAEAWLSADFWFYPCIFMETFCLTALEAASSKTFAITNNLAALQNTVGDRGAIIKGDATTKEWQNKSLETLFYYMDERNSKEKHQFIEKNYRWSCELTWKNQANLLLNNYITNEKYNTNNII